MSSVRLSLIIPAYNSAAFIADTLECVTRFLAGRGENSELIVVDDGSTDGSSPLLTDLAAADQSIRLVRNGANRGKGYAVRAGVLQASAGGKRRYPPPHAGSP